MTENVSNLYGRSFEYTITDELLHLPGATLTLRAIGDQARDAANFLQLPPNLAEHFRAGACCIFRNIHHLLPLGVDLNNVIIDRLPDMAGRADQGNVTDIQLSFPNYILNLSIKNNHFALKHQRPPSLMQQLGFIKDGPEDRTYRMGLQRIIAAFYQRVQERMPHAVKFRDLAALGNDFISNNLYAPVCDYVSQILQAQLRTQAICQHFFSFLTGETNYTKLILLNDRVEVHKFNEITIPTMCTVQRSANSYIHLSFNNRWQLSLRLHTASSAIGNSPSLKFDTQGNNLPIPRAQWPL